VQLDATRTVGTPYGASHVSGIADDRPVSDSERTLAIAQGRRLAELAVKLAR
jgi:NAD(P)H dehydrogenase (quinone)